MAVGLPRMQPLAPGCADAILSVMDTHRLCTRVVRSFAAATILSSLLLGMSGCGSDSLVYLSFDYQSREQWRYGLAVTVSGHAGPAGVFQNSARAIVCLNTTTDSSAIDLALDSVTIASTLLDSTHRRHIEQRLGEMHLPCDWHEGLLIPVNTRRISDISIGGWNLYRSALRLVPALPSTPVHAGQRWGRERHLQLETTLGDAVGHLYQEYVLDSVSRTDDGRVAHISWKFSYQLEVDSDTVTATQAGIPLSGKGTGVAWYSVDHAHLIRAEVSFAAPGGAEGDRAPWWREQASMQVAGGNT